MNQNEKVLQFIKDTGAITTWDAYSQFGCTRLSARISDLRKQGHPIISKTETSKNRYGESVTYSRCSLDEI